MPSMRKKRALRQAAILEALEAGEPLRIEELRNRFGVSLVTLRADLADLQAQGQLIRTHGGAVRVPRAEVPYAQRAAAHASQKAAIGATAARLVRDGEVILLDCGSTTLQVALHLALRPEVTIITNDLPIGMELCRRHHPQSILLGGALSTPHLCVVGPETERALAGLRVDRLFLATDGVSEGRLMERSPLTVSAKQAMIHAANEVVLVADSSKFGQAGVSAVCELPVVHRVITDEGLPEDWRALLAEGLTLVTSE